MQTAGEIRLQQDVDVLRIDAAVFPAGLPGIAGVVRVLVLLNPDLRLRKEVRPVSVVPMSVREHNVRDLLRLYAEWRHRLVRPYEVIDLPVFEKLRTVETCVDEDSVPAAANQPDHHGDVQLARFVRAFDKSCDREVRNRCVADGVDL